MSAPPMTRWVARARRAFARVSGRARIESFTADRPRAGAMRVLYVANAFIPTLQLSFVKPLQPLVDAGDVVAELLSEEQLKEVFGKAARNTRARDWVLARAARFRPDVVVFCRYSGPHVEDLLAWARRERVATVFHIDDDLQRVPPEIGRAKYEFHNQTVRVAAVQALLEGTDVVYCSTAALLERLAGRGIGERGIAGRIYCSGEPMSGPPAPAAGVKVGYMGFDHAHDLELALPAIVSLLDRRPQVSFELFGSIPRPAALERFRDRVRTLPPVHDYERFMATFAGLDWAVGICPLAGTAFNAVKANTKWVEYTSVGAAVIATSGPVYDTCCADGCGVLARDGGDWERALDKLATDAAARQALVERAQIRLRAEYSVERLREQVMSVLSRARQAATAE